MCAVCVCVMYTCVMFVLCVVDPPVKKSTLFSSLTTGATGRQSVCSTLARKVLNMLVSGSPSLPRLFTSSTARPALYIAWDTGRRRPGEPIISELFLNREQCSVPLFTMNPKIVAHLSHSQIGFFWAEPGPLTVLLPGTCRSIGMFSSLYLEVERGELECWIASEASTCNLWQPSRGRYLCH